MNKTISINNQLNDKLNNVIDSFSSTGSCLFNDICHESKIGKQL